MSTMERHGTPSGYKRHQRAQETPCDACYAAKAAYDARRRSASDQQMKRRASARAQGRAETRLRRAHPEEYQRYYAEEKAQASA